jgi:CRISPR/Cas system-associated exonuclease Cas4 (RecB family)
MIPRTGKPYVYVTWVTGLLAGTDQCKWKAWVKSHYKYTKGIPGEDPKEKASSERFLKQWIKNHDAMTNSRVPRLQAEGYTVRVEDDNSFKLAGESAILAGKPDIIATKDDAKFALVVDEKSGKEKPEHRWQVLIYMFALRITKLKDYIIHGEIEHKDKSIPILAHELNKESTDHILNVVRLMGGPEPKATPSPGECRFCDILECPYRYQTATTTDARDYF